MPMPRWDLPRRRSRKFKDQERVARKRELSATVQALQKRQSAMAALGMTQQANLVAALRLQLQVLGHKRFD